MAFVDELKIYARSGKGGDGVERWLHIKGKEKGGPSGGNGGKGGDIYVRAVRNLSVLADYTHDTNFVAESGGDGMKDSLHGKNGEDLIIDVPIGSVVTRSDWKKLPRVPTPYELEEYGDDWKNGSRVHAEPMYGRKIELLEEGQTELLLKGGDGGFGNESFKSSRHTTPKKTTSGWSAEEANFFIEVRLMVDAGFVGLPSAGKSSLLNELTSAKAKVGAYPFTTLEPSLGVLYGYVLADVPGLIKGAAEGKGLGHKFLRHISRTKMILHCVSLEDEDVVASYKTIRAELEKFNPELIEKPEMIILTKTDVTDEATIKKAEKDLSKFNKNIQTVSVYDDESLKNLSDSVTKFLKK